MTPQDVTDTPERVRPPAGTSGIDDCPSPAHRAVALALRAVVTGAIPDDLAERMGDVSDQDFAEIAQSHHVDTALAPLFAQGGVLAGAFPRELGIFFTEMHRANAARNARFRAQLGEIGAAMAAAGIPCVALKGATELLDPWWRDPDGRYLSDLDFLVPADRLGDAGRVLENLGAVAAPAEEINQAGHHHAPPYVSSAWEGMVELHHALGPPLRERVLTGAEVLDAARPSALPGISLPAPEHRLAHLLAHAHLEEGPVRRTRMELRDLAGFWRGLQRLEPSGVAAAGARFQAAGQGALWEGYLELARAVFEGHAPRTPWARDALRDYGQPGHQRAGQAWAWARFYAREILLNPARRRHYLGKLFRPGGLGEVIEFHRERHYRIR